MLESISPPVQSHRVLVGKTPLPPPKIAKGPEEVFGEIFLRKIVGPRKQDKVKREEEEALVDLYLSAIGGL